MSKIERKQRSDVVVKLCTLLNTYVYQYIFVARMTSSLYQGSTLRGLPASAERQLDCLRERIGSPQEFWKGDMSVCLSVFLSICVSLSFYTSVSCFVLDTDRLCLASGLGLRATVATISSCDSWLHTCKEQKEDGGRSKQGKKHIIIKIHLPTVNCHFQRLRTTTWWVSMLEGQCLQGLLSLKKNKAQMSVCIPGVSALFLLLQDLHEVPWSTCSGTDWDWTSERHYAFPAAGSLCWCQWCGE